ncbi:MAG: carboxypeptidase-like regulatory domain-containing protein [Nonlabens sp.]|uniref:carboxypeptidase-like regulatory domain-containing protein n=1 Tax=Nonlabens sp. TaxID=1888209 RepID=UPI003EF5FD9D
MKVLKQITIALLLLITATAGAQNNPSTTSTEKSSSVFGKVLNAKNDSILSNVNIVNLNQVKGTISTKTGAFKIPAKVNDTLFFSYIGFETITIKVTEDWLKFGDVTISMTEKGIALEQIDIKANTLTGFLEIDARKAPIYNNRRYSISGLPKAYEAGNDKPGAITTALNSIFNPADFLYNVFGKKGSSMRKLRQIKEQDEIRNLLQSKYDRETLMNLLQMDKVSIDAVLRNCQYSKSFIETANDLQILDAISECYEEYKILKRK